MEDKKYHYEVTEDGTVVLDQNIEITNFHHSVDAEKKWESL